MTGPPQSHRPADGDGATPTTLVSDRTVARRLALVIAGWLDATL